MADVIDMADGMAVMAGMVPRVITRRIKPFMLKQIFIPFRIKNCFGQPLHLLSIHPSLKQL